MPSTRLLPLLALSAAALAACAELKKDAAATGDAMKGMAETGTCPAAEHQDWVGKSVAVLNDAALPEGTRVLFPTTPATMDLREDRMNVEVDKADRITRVYCG